MNKKILDILEFDKVKQLFEPYLQTEQGEMELAALTPTDKKESIETAFMELEDMEQILLEEPRFAVSTIQVSVQWPSVWRWRRPSISMNY